MTRQPHHMVRVRGLCLCKACRERWPCKGLKVWKQRRKKGVSREKGAEHLHA